MTINLVKIFEFIYFCGNVNVTGSKPNDNHSTYLWANVNLGKWDFATFKELSARIVTIHVLSMKFWGIENECINIKNSVYYLFVSVIQEFSYSLGRNNVDIVHIVLKNSFSQKICFIQTLRMPTLSFRKLLSELRKFINFRRKMTQKVKNSVNMWLHPWNKVTIRENNFSVQIFRTFVIVQWQWLEWYVESN